MQYTHPTFIVTVSNEPSHYLLEFINSLLRQNVYDWTCLFLINKRSSDRNKKLINEYCFLDNRFIQFNINSNTANVLEQTNMSYYAYVDVRNQLDFNAAYEYNLAISEGENYNVITCNTRKLNHKNYYYPITCELNSTSSKYYEEKNILILYKKTDKIEKEKIKHIPHTLYLIR